MNYYVREPVCPHCRRKASELHIGKSSMGWSFSFRGYRGWEEPLIASYAEWLDHLAQAVDEGQEIVDEDGGRLTLEEFKEMVEKKRGGKNHTLYCLDSSMPGNREHAERNCALDEEGHSFSFCEFS